MIESLKVYDNKSGKLVPLEFDKLPFTPLRIFWTTRFKINETGGGHAHYKTQQYIICIQGRVAIDLYDGFVRHRILLNEHEAVFVDKLIWDSQQYLTGNDIILVLASTLYDSSDYIFDIDEFEKIKKEGL